LLAELETEIAFRQFQQARLANPANMVLEAIIRQLSWTLYFVKIALGSGRGFGDWHGVVSWSINEH